MATSLVTISLLAGGLIAGRVSARFSPFSLLPAAILLLIAWIARPGALLGLEFDLPNRLAQALPIALLILFATSVCALAIGSRGPRNSSLISAGAVASAGAILSQDVVVLTACVGSSVLLCIRNAWVGSSWQGDRTVSSRVGVSSVLAVLQMVIAAILIQSHVVQANPQLLGPAIGLLIVSLMITSSAFPFGGLMPAFADAESHYRWNVSGGLAQLMTIFLVFLVFETTSEITELDYWPVATAVLMVVLSLTAVRCLISADRNITMSCGRFAISAVAVTVIMAGGWFAWLGLFAGGIALIGNAVSGRPELIQTELGGLSRHGVLSRIAFLTTAGLPGSAAFVLWWMTIHIAVSMNMLVSILVGGTGMLVVSSLSNFFSKLEVSGSSVAKTETTINGSRGTVVLALVLTNVVLGIYPAPFINIMSDWHMLLGTYP